MAERSALLLMIAGVAGLVLAACASSNTALGPDRDSASDATKITWEDGKPAFSITCALPQGCNERANLVCLHGVYKVLKSENMPSVGDRLAVLGRPSVVIRCG